MRLEGRVALVTGGGIRLGRAIVQALAAGGAALAVHHHHSGDGALALVAELRAAGRRAEAFHADLTDDAELGALVSSVERTLGPIDVLVNSAAPGTVLPPESLGAAEREELRTRIPLQRFGTPEDVAETVRFLVTGPDFITGQVVAVDGGRVRGSR